MEDFLAKVRAAGVIGAGGAGFPSAVKLNSSPEIVLVNGAECEPLLQVDQKLAALKAESLLETLNELVQSLGAARGVFALKAKYTEAVAELEKHLPKWPRLSLKTLGNYYPMGDEQVLVYEALGRIVPEGGIPIACGVVVVNVETLLNIGSALDAEQPVIEKYITIAGAVKTPRTFKVPIGVPLSDLVAASGGATVSQPVYLNGGPMMGGAATDFSRPVTKTSKGIIVLNADHPLIISKSRSIEEMMRIGKTACCHCMMCTDLCPRYMLGHKLYPDKLMRLASYNSTCEKEVAATGAFLCCECGMCEIACIMSLQPWKLNQELKKRLGALGIKNPHHEAPKDVNRFRQYRQFPIPKLIRRLGLAQYDHIDAPLSNYDQPVTKVTLPLKQHLGAPSMPVVSLGQELVKGQLVAAPPEGALGANIHTSISGQVKSLDQSAIVIERI